MTLFSFTRPLFCDEFFSSEMMRNTITSSKGESGTALSRRTWSTSGLARSFCLSFSGLSMEGLGIWAINARSPQCVREWWMCRLRWWRRGWRGGGWPLKMLPPNRFLYLIHSHAFERPSSYGLGWGVGVAWWRVTFLPGYSSGTGP